MSEAEMEQDREDFDRAAEQARFDKGNANPDTVTDMQRYDVPLSDKEWTDALMAGAAALEGLVDATTGWQAHDARVCAARLRYGAAKINAPRNPPAPEGSNG